MTTGRALERFLRYVQVDTQSNEASKTQPSTEGQRYLLRMLRDELGEMGAADVALDDHGYLTASVPATVSRQGVPAVGFLAHVDTSPETPGRNVRPIVHEGYDGRDLVLPDDPAMVLRASEDPALARQLGSDIVTASGLTLLGADDKAGVAEIMTGVERLLARPEIPHGVVRVGFTPDEEIGRGANHFDVRAFAADFAYTLDGGARGELEYESFSADAMTVTFHGFNTHPGYARGRMVNAVKAAGAFVASFPPDRLSPETTDGYDGYVHPYIIEGGTERATVRVLLRDFEASKLREQQALLEGLARAAADRVPGVRIECRVQESYRNMREVLERAPHVIEYAKAAIRCGGLEPVVKPIRGGTDGSRLSFMGLPTANLFAGQHNFHSRLEWVSAQDMDLAVDVIVHLCRLCAEPRS